MTIYEDLDNAALGAEYRRLKSALGELETEMREREVPPEPTSGCIRFNLFDRETAQVHPYAAVRNLERRWIVTGLTGSFTWPQVLGLIYAPSNGLLPMYTEVASMHEVRLPRWTEEDES